MSEVVALAVGCLLFFFAGVPLAVVILYPLYLLGYTVGKVGVGIAKLRRISSPGSRPS